MQPRRDPGVIQAGIITAFAADDLKQAGVAALRPTLHDAAGWRRKTVPLSPGRSPVAIPVSFAMACPLAHGPGQLGSRQ
jgi:hypothetical protein